MRIGVLAKKYVEYKQFVAANMRAIAEAQNNEKDPKDVVKVNVKSPCGCEWAVSTHHQESTT